MRDELHLAAMVAQARQEWDARHMNGHAINLTVSRLVKCLGIPEQRALVWQPHLEAAMMRFGITTPLRAAAFMAQIGHESGRLVYVKEVWTNSPAQQSYEGAQRLGNTEPGDGARFMGRGPMQITGRRNYTFLGSALGVDFAGQPALLERIDYGALSAGWFWHTGAGLNLGKKAREAVARQGFNIGVNLNDLADIDDFETITLCVNGGLNGYADRCELYEQAKRALVIEPPSDGADLRFERVP